ncbi:MAG: 5'-nucleotidase C-terminal domain-containing protein [Mangrovibacterium sp.]
MKKSFLLIAFIFGLLSCKSTLIIQDIHMQNIPNYENISTIDPAIEQLVAPYKQNLEADMQEIIAISTVELVKEKPESLLTNYLADLLLEEGARYAYQHPLQPLPNLAYLNYGGLRTQLPKGEITVGKIFELMPFENEMVLVQLTGADLYELASRLAANGGDCVSGIKLGIKDNKIGTFEIAGNPLNQTALYWVVTNDYVAEGGDGMTMLLNRKKYIQTGLKLRDCFIDHMRNEYQKGRTISPKLDGRIYYE